MHLSPAWSPRDIPRSLLSQKSLATGRIGAMKTGKDIMVRALRRDPQVMG